MSAVIKVMGVPVRGVDVLSIAGTKVVGSATSAADGTCAIEAGATSIAARFTEPFLGVVVHAVTDGNAEIDIDRAQIVKVACTVRVPDGATFDWVDFKLTPRVELPPVVVLHDAEGLREAYWIRRYTQPTFEVRVLAGRWEARAGREIDGGVSVQGSKNLQLGSVDCDGQRPAAKFMGFEVEIDHDVKLALQMIAAS